MMRVVVVMEMPMMVVVGRRKAAVVVTMKTYEQVNNDEGIVGIVTTSLTGGEAGRW
jgi:hypothetical protein